MSDETAAHGALGFSYQKPAAPVPVIAPIAAVKVCREVRRHFAALVHASVALEDIDFRREEIERLLDGITVGGRRLEDEQQILNEARAWQSLIGLVESRAFGLDETTLCELHRQAARDPGLTWGVFQDRTIPVGGTYYRAPRSHILDERFEPGMQALRAIRNSSERAAACFLFISLHQFLINSNERVARLMMQGVLMAGGYRPLRVPPSMRMELDIRMMRFYDTLDGSDVMQFLLAQRGAPGEQGENRKKRRGLGILGL